ncbi:MULTISPECIES: 2OG-Fe(II) oxygenase [Acidobacteriaceae]|uniref:2OG-Fe(II) oxygenase n=1 Tax=Acidobacteriaceae TaxID=204434 RepID=UPI00131D5D35|nr:MULTISPECIES: 2OG-Fe(II) oxygenase [Acidobacteriaceae]MDW5266114.1 2OG-Fe(II) oxygenase [Edaphobacter sp.]
MTRNGRTLQSGFLMRRKPFPHFIADEFFTKTESKMLLKWLETSQEWKQTVGSYFDYDRILVGSAKLPAPVSRLLKSRSIERLRELVEEHFKREMSTGARIMAHRLRPGNGIGLHTDESVVGVVLNIYLNRHWDDAYGGHLVLFNSNNERDVASIIRPEHGRAVALLVDSKSFHAVSEVCKGQRFAISYFFRAL